MKNCCFKLILSVVFLLIMVDVHAQNVRVTGVVSDTQGPLIGVNVLRERFCNWCDYRYKR